MISIPLGKIAVPTPGTPVAITLTATQAAQLPRSGLVTKIEARADTADAGTVWVEQSGAKLAALPVPSGGHAEHWDTPELDTGVNPLAYSVDAAVAGNGPFVTLWVE
jgi:hypothetical protein